MKVIRGLTAAVRRDHDHWLRGTMREGDPAPTGLLRSDLVPTPIQQPKRLVRLVPVTHSVGGHQ